MSVVARRGPVLTVAGALALAACGGRTEVEPPCSGGAPAETGHIPTGGRSVTYGGGVNLESGGSGGTAGRRTSGGAGGTLVASGGSNTGGAAPGGTGGTLVASGGSPTGEAGVGGAGGAVEATAGAAGAGGVAGSAGTAGGAAGAAGATGAAGAAGAQASAGDVDLALSWMHSCAQLPPGMVKCWGENGGWLGLGDAEDRGDEPGEMGEALPTVALGSGLAVMALAAGEQHQCAVFEDGRVKCWGFNYGGVLGLGDEVHRGAEPGDMGDNLPFVELGGSGARMVAAQSIHTCALLDSGGLKCWGANGFGQLGLGDTETRGDEPGEMGDALPTVDLGAGRTATTVAPGTVHTCALLDDGTVKCWGYNAGGRLGLGDTEDRGDEPGEMGDALPAVDLGTGRTATALGVGSDHACALLDGGTVKCWGGNGGRLGLGDRDDRGDEPGEMGDALPAVDLGSGEVAVALAVGGYHACALLASGSVKCWGSGSYGQLGLGEQTVRGRVPSEMGDALPAVDLGTTPSIASLRAGLEHTCVVFQDASVKCWGWNEHGQLGLGDRENRGDEPGEMGEALPFLQL